MKMNSILFSLTLLLPLSLVIPSSLSLCNPQDKRALLQIKKSLGNPPVLASWAKDTDCCTWNMASCDKNTHRIVNLDLFGDGTPGHISDSVGDLPYLEILVFQNFPNLTGTIPFGVTKLKHMRAFFVTGTSMTGPIPSYLSTIKSLAYLDLSNNSFTGTLPPSLSKLPKLGNIHLELNKLTGNIPESYGGFTANFPPPLLHLSDNQLTGTVPNSLGNIDWTWIDLSRNKLEGNVSFLFGEGKTATAITLSNNMFEFDLSNVEFPPDLLYLDLSHNKITGSLPAELLQVGDLKTFDVSYNQLCGEIPQGGNFQTFGIDSYSHNKCLCGSPLPACK